MQAVVAARTAGEVLAELLRRGYTLNVATRVAVVDRPTGSHAVTYGEKLIVRGGEAPPDDLRQGIVDHRDELLAAACVSRPPVGWLEFLVERHRERRAPLSMVAANVAAFIGLHPAHDGPRLEAIIEETLR
jgi:hypothetical protein